MFFRPKDKSAEESFKKLRPTSTDFLIDYYTRNIKISDHNLPEGTIAKYHADIVEFQKEQMALMDHLRNFKGHIK